MCGGSEAGPSWMGSTWYAGRKFEYRECRACRSLYCCPMPDADLLEQMYGPAYAASFADDAAIDDPKQPLRVLDWLKSRPLGIFLDYGCGQGGLLKGAKALGWKALGVEFSEKVVRNVAAETGCLVVTDPALLPGGGVGVADVLHLGDVLEHLTEMNRQMPEILRLIKPGGYLLAQGPLEANPTLFTAALRTAKRLGKGGRTEMAPYHVTLATAEGQRALFRRFGLEEETFHLREVDWPAPSKLTGAVLRSPRSLALFTLRKLSQVAAAVQPRRWGNRYFYAGRVHG